MSAIRSKWLLYAVWGALPVAICGGAGFVPVSVYAQDQKDEKKGDKKDEKKDEKKTLELKPERKIEFSTDEGTWLSLDISPDGRTIVFELLGDIYTLPVEGGEAKLISGGMPFDSQPRFSPDGKWIAFLSDRDGGENVWIMKPDGSDPRQLSKETWADFASPSWTPDSNYVLVSKTTEALSTYELWMKTALCTKATRSTNSGRNKRSSRLYGSGISISQRLASLCSMVLPTNRSRSLESRKQKMEKRKRPQICGLSPTSFLWLEPEPSHGSSDTIRTCVAALLQKVPPVHNPGLLWPG